MKKKKKKLRAAYIYNGGIMGEMSTIAQTVPASNIIPVRCSHHITNWYYIPGQNDIKNSAGKIWVKLIM